MTLCLPLVLFVKNSLPQADFEVALKNLPKKSQILEQAAAS
jgi:hypothetical protein